MNVIRKTYARLGVIAGLGLASIAAQASTDPFDAALASAQSAVTDYAGALVGLGAAAVVFMIGLKYVKKLTRAA